MALAPLALAVSCRGHASVPASMETTVRMADGYGTETPESCEYTHFSEHLVAQALAQELLVTGKDSFKIEGSTGPFTSTISISSAPKDWKLDREKMLDWASSISEDVIRFEIAMLNFESKLDSPESLEDAKVELMKRALRGLSGCADFDSASLTVEDGRAALLRTKRSRSAREQTKLLARSSVMPGIWLPEDQSQSRPIIAVAHTFSAESLLRADEFMTDFLLEIGVIAPEYEFTVHKLAKFGFVLIGESKTVRGQSVAVGVSERIGDYLAASNRMPGSGAPDVVGSYTTYQRDLAKRGQAQCIEVPMEYREKIGTVHAQNRLRNILRFEKRIAFDGYLNMEKGLVCAAGLRGNLGDLKLIVAELIQ